MGVLIDGPSLKLPQPKACQQPSGLVEMHLNEACDLELDRYLALYYQSCSDFSAAPLLHLSASCDKSRVHSIGVSNAAFAFPDNHCMWGVPQALFRGCSWVTKHTRTQRAE